MIVAASKVNIDAIGNREHSSTRLIWAIDAIGNRELASIGVLVASVTDDTTTIKLTGNYRNDRTTYKLNSGLFSDTTAHRFVFYFFCHCTKYF
jgi:hypothetical protein